MQESNKQYLWKTLETTLQQLLAFCGIEHTQFSKRPNRMSALHLLPPTRLKFADNFTYKYRSWVVRFFNIVLHGWLLVVILYATHKHGGAQEGVRETLLSLCKIGTYVDSKKMLWLQKSSLTDIQVQLHKWRPSKSILFTVLPEDRPH